MSCSIISCITALKSSLCYVTFQHQWKVLIEPYKKPSQMPLYTELLIGDEHADFTKQRGLPQPFCGIGSLLVVCLSPSHTPWTLSLTLIDVMVYAWQENAITRYCPCPRAAGATSNAQPITQVRLSKSRGTLLPLPALYLFCPLVN